MKIIAGLGNPGIEYSQTRHNIGFMFLDYIRDSLGFEEFKDSKFKGLISEGNINGEKIILLKPMTYMNLSGESIQSIIEFYKLSSEEDLLVIFDDISMDFGKIRFRKEGTAGGHNGIKSIISRFSKEKFNRIKIGVGYDNKYDVSSWVLSKFKKEEFESLEGEIFEKVLELMKKEFIL